MQPLFSLPEYDIYTGSLQGALREWLENRHYSHLFLVTDEHVWHHCVPAFLEKSALPAHLPSVIVPAGEPAKNLATCARIWKAMFNAGLDRKSLVINLGGGVIGDMGGFCAATYKRGVDFVQVPTSLLAMTDAAIGGKLGVDFEGIKNAVGLFKNPAAVFVDPDFLQTLPPRELRSGFAEVIKHALIGDPDLWNRIAQLQPAGRSGALALTTDDWLAVLLASIAVKVRIVLQDPLEKNIRALLNFGHTVGHALESYYLESDDPLTHGEAVAIGMICENPGLRAGLSAVILRHFPHRPVPAAAFSELWQFILQDKKNTSGTVRMAVPDATPFSMRIIEPSRTAIEERLSAYNALDAIA